MIDALENGGNSSPFGKYEEEAIVALLLDHPEFFSNIANHLSDQLFARVEVKYIVAHVLEYYEKYGTFPTRNILRDRVVRHLTVDDVYVDDVLQIVDKKADPREIPAIKERLLEWARHRAYDLLYSKETIERFNQGDYAYVEEVFEKARRIQDISGKSLWFFQELEKLFVEDDSERFTTSIGLLDTYLNSGGPRRKEMTVIMAPTGVGKSIFLANCAVANSKMGKKVLYITLELSDFMSALRSLGALTDRSMNSKEARNANKEAMIGMAKLTKQNGAGDIVIHEFPPDEVNVDAILGLMDNLRRNNNFVPDVIVVDYLELLVSRRDTDNADGYTRQKSVSTQLRGLAIKTNTHVFTATQTNRSGNDTSQSIDVTKMAESYGKAMPMDYLISINQTVEEYKDSEDDGAHPGRADARLYIAKNRNGPKFKTIDIQINYRSMNIRQVI